MGNLQLNCKVNKKAYIWQNWRSIDHLSNWYLLVDDGYILFSWFYLILSQPEAKKSNLRPGKQKWMKQVIDIEANKRLMALLSDINIIKKFPLWHIWWEILQKLICGKFQKCLFSFFSKKIFDNINFSQYL